MIESTAKFWEAIYTRNINKMIGICYRYTANRQLAEDLAHDAFLKAIDKAGSFKGEGVFDGWLRKVVVNHVLTYIRDQKRHRCIDDALRHENNGVHPDEDSELTGQAHDTEFSARELLDVIDALPEHHRLVFNLYVIDDFKHAQIAEALGISEGTSKSHLARARKKIKQLLTEKARKKQGRNSVILLLLFPFNAWSMDRLYKKQFSSLRFAHSKALPDFSHVPSVSMSLPYANTTWFIAAASCVGVLMVVSVIVYLTLAESTMHPLKNALSQSVPEDSSRTKSSREVKYSEKATNEKNNSHHAGSFAATFQRNSVIQSKIIKTNRMKKLDSLGIALLVSSGLAFDSVAQSTGNADTSKHVEMHVVALGNDPVQATSVVQFSAPDRGQEKRDPGRNILCYEFILVC